VNALLRDAAPADVPAVARLIRGLAEYEGKAGELRGTEADYAAALFGTPPRAYAMLAERAGEPVGLALWYFLFPTFVAKPVLYVEDIYVQPAQRGLGIGRGMFAELARRALAADCVRMEWSVLHWNTPALAFYRGLGAVPVTEWIRQRLEGEALAALAG
jgi:GNAT superfamily N-acetyltransferase